MEGPIRIKRSHPFAGTKPRLGVWWGRVVVDTNRVAACDRPLESRLGTNIACAIQLKDGGRGKGWRDELFDNRPTDWVLVS